MPESIPTARQEAMGRGCSYPQSSALSLINIPPNLSAYKN